MKKFRILLLMVVFMMSFVGSALSEQVTADKSPWSGTFVRDRDSFFSSTLEITDTTADSFKFRIKAYSGGNTGGVTGTAKINGTTALYTDVKGGFLKFVLNENTIIIEEKKMNFYQGMGVGFRGEYINEKKSKSPVEKENYFTDFNVFKGNQEQEFKRLVGDNYKKFTNTGHMFYIEEDLDGLGVRVHRMGVRGLFTILESIIMIRDSDNAIWAAVIDNDRVLYFTNTNDAKYVPITISRWHDRFKKKPIYLIKIESFQGSLFLSPKKPTLLKIQPSFF